MSRGTSSQPTRLPASVPSLAERQEAMSATPTPGRLRSSAEKRLTSALTSEPETKKPAVSWRAKSLIYLVAKGGIEPPTRGFSIRCSTD